MARIEKSKTAHLERPEIAKPLIPSRRTSENRSNLSGFPVASRRTPSGDASFRKTPPHASPDFSQCPQAKEWKELSYEQNNTHT
jgi:hypothetical protein